MNIRIGTIAILAVLGLGQAAPALADGDKGSSGVSASFLFRDLTGQPPVDKSAYVICYDAQVTAKKDDKGADVKEIALFVNTKGGHKVGGLECTTWQSALKPPDMNGIKHVIIAIETNDKAVLESNRKLTVSVSSQAVSSASDVRPQAGFGPSALLPGGGAAAVAGQYFLLWPYELNGGTTTTVSVGIVSTRDEKDTVAGTDWMVPAIPATYHFGIMPGVAWSTVKTRSVAYAPGSTASSFTPVEQTGSHLVDPVLFLSWYWRGMNPAAAPNRNDQAIVFGVSFKEPTGRFYVGYSFEPIRNIAVVIGGNAAKVTKLAPAWDPGPSDSHATPPSKDKFDYGAFVSVAFNFSAFLQQAIGGGK